jgi:hypothetical protein
MITKILDTIIESDMCLTAEQVRDLVAYARHTYEKYYGEPLSEEDIRLFSAGGNPERLTATQKEFILNRRAELQLANRRAVFHLFQFMGFRELGLVNSLEEYMKIFPPEVPKPLLLTAYERAKEKAG